MDIEEIRARNMRLRRLPTELRERGDELSLLAAEMIESLRSKTASHLSWTDIPTGYRVDLFAPDNQCFAIAGERPLALQIAGGKHDTTMTDTTDWDD